MLWLAPNQTVFGSLAHCSVRLDCCSATVVLACSAICLPEAAADWAAFLSLSFHPPRPVVAGAAAAGGGGGGASAGRGSTPVVPPSDTCSVHEAPSQYRTWCVPTGSGSHPAS